MHGYNWGYRGTPRMGGFFRWNYIDSPLGFWLIIALLVLVTVAIVLLIIKGKKKYQHLDEETGALATIKRRYANGELTNEEFQRMKKDLK
ncbi:MAG: SHOCT domain-containing protein [Sphaerochaetaceae bacterium]|nr:SHOCT domain-containing protein [Sphaerochaetaceae bacterium]